MALASSALAALLAPVAFLLAFAGLSRVDGVRHHPLAEFEIPAIGPPERSVARGEEHGKVVQMFQADSARGGEFSVDGIPDAAQALSAALADLKRSLR